MCIKYLQYIFKTLAVFSDLRISHCIVGAA
jgi:hypothetical protein